MEVEVKSFFLLLTRFGVIFWLPLTGPMSRIPTSVRALIVTSLVLVIFALWLPDLSIKHVSSMPFVLALLNEFGFGIMLAFIFALPVAALLFFGRVIDMQLGLGAAGVLNPATNSNDSLTGSAFALAIITLFWVLDLHLELIGLLIKSTGVIPLGMVTSLPIEMLVNFFSQMFILAFYLAFPVMVILFAVDVASGLVSKNMPQMNVYFVLIPLKILVGCIVISIVVKQLSNRFEQLVQAPVNFLLGL